MSTEKLPNSTVNDCDMSEEITKLNDKVKCNKEVCYERHEDPEYHCNLCAFHHWNNV